MCRTGGLTKAGRGCRRPHSQDRSTNGTSTGKCIFTDTKSSGLKRDGVCLPFTVCAFFLPHLCSHAHTDTFKILPPPCKTSTSRFCHPTICPLLQQLGMVPLTKVLLLNLVTQSQKKQPSTDGYVFSPDTACRPTCGPAPRHHSQAVMVCRTLQCLSGVILGDGTHKRSGHSGPPASYASILCPILQAPSHGSV